MTDSRNETRYLLARAIRTRGLALLLENEDTFCVHHAGGSFKLTLMPENRRVLISSAVVVDPRYRLVGVGRRMLNLREVIAKEAGINLLLATVRNDNAVEIHLLETSGWKRFTNRDTGVSLWGKEL
jgi:GNAT superfamily N-acetyltransferase